jgi:cell division septal protein FtsQ
LRQIFWLLLFGLAQRIFFMSPMWRLETVSVTGNSRLASAAILQEAGLQPGCHLFELPLHEAEQRITQLHWIQNVAVRRSFPSGAVIRVQEKTPVLAVARDTASVPAFPKKWFVVSNEGQVLAAAGASGDDKLPRVLVRHPLAVGTILHPRLVSTVLACLRQIPPETTRGMSLMRADGEGDLAIVVKVDGKPVEVKLGDADHTRYKLAVLKALLGRLQVENKPIAYIDLRYGDPAVGYPHSLETKTDAQTSHP